MKTPSSKTSSGVRRAISFVVKGAIGLVALTAVYIAVPAVTNAPGMAAIVGMPLARDALAEIGLTPADVKSGGYFASFAMQSAATLVSVISGFSINTSYGESWSVPDSVLRALKTPGEGTAAVLATRCSDGERTTSVLVFIAQPGHLAQDNSHLIPDQAQSFEPETPLKLREYFDFLETGAFVQALHSRPQFFWRFPRVGSFSDTTSRRAEVKELYPDMDRPDCTNDGSSALTMSESIGRIAGLEGLASYWKNPRYKFPKRIKIGAVSIGGNAIFTHKEGTMLVQATHSGESAHEAMLIKQAALRTTFEKHGPLSLIVHLHRDGRLSEDIETYKLRDGRVSMSTKKEGALNTLSIRYAPD